MRDVLLGLALTLWDVVRWTTDRSLMPATIASLTWIGFQLFDGYVAHTHESGLRCEYGFGWAFGACAAWVAAGLLVLIWFVAQMEGYVTLRWSHAADPLKARAQEFRDERSKRRAQAGDLSEPVMQGGEVSKS